ncbi:titin-like isoform X2 [Gouania willdenowi]|uniref:titin-like isoform X2 n=1 Tax=Gouania willdenowi TaxID=441366 RepID=UPI0010548540|nr:titin-like isoform X2 [Gouania willdenowi]
MKFPVDLLAGVSQEELEQSAERYMKNLLHSDPDDPERLTISGSTQAPIDVSSVGVVPLYGFDKQKILALFTASDRFTAVALYLLDRWWPVEDILRTADDTRNGAVEVKTVGERIVLYVLNRIIYRAREMSHDELPFLCHGKQDYAKILWKDGEAVGFYSVKCTGSPRNSFSSMTYQLPVMDSMFVRKSHRGKGFGLQMLEDYVQSFEEDFLGLRCPLTKSMFKVCEKFLGQYPGDTDLLWEVEGIGEPRQRTNIANKIQAMDLSVSKSLSFSEEMVKSVEAAQRELVMEEITTRLDDVKSTKCTVEIIEEVTVLKVSNGDMPVVGRNQSSGSRRRKAKETSEKVIRVEDIEAETPNEVQVPVQQKADLQNIPKVKPPGVLSTDEMGESLDRSSAEDLVIVDENSATDKDSPDSEEPVVASVLPPEETQVKDDATCLTAFSSNSLITVENVVSESQKTEAECQNEAQTCMSTESHDTITEEMQTAVIDDKEDTIPHSDISHLDSVNVFEDSNATKSQIISEKTTKSREGETFTRRPLRHSTLDGKRALRGRTLQVTLIHTNTSQTQKVSEESVEEFYEVTKELPEDTDEFVETVEAGHGQATTEKSINESYVTNMEKEEEEKLQDEESFTEVTKTVDGREMATASETETNDKEPDKQIKETCQMEPEEEDKEKSEEDISKAESNGEDILVTTNVDETNETVQKNDTAKETINQPAMEAEEEWAGDEVSTIEERTSQNSEPNDSFNESVIPVAEKSHDIEADDSIHKLQNASVTLVDLKSTNQPNVITPDETCSYITEEKLDLTVETEREVSMSVADGQTESKKLVEDLVGQKEMVDATTEMEMSEQKENEMHIRETRVLRSGKKSQRVSSRKSKSALQEETSKVDISSNKEVDLPVLEGDLAQETILPNKTVREISSEEDDIPVVETRARRVSQKLTVTPRSSRRKTVKGEKNSQEEQQASPTRTLRHRKPTVYATPTRKYRRSRRVTNEDKKTGEHVEDNAMNEDSAIELVDKKDDKIDETNLNEDDGKASSEDEQIKLDLGEKVAPTTSEPLEEHAEKPAPEEASANNDGQSLTVTRVLRSGKKTRRGHKTFQNEAEEEEEAKKVKLDEETTEEIEVEVPVTAELAFPPIAKELDTDGFLAPVEDALQEEEIIASAERHTSEEVTPQLSHIQNVTIDLVDLRKNEGVHKPVLVETMTVDTIQDNSDMENKNDEIVEETEAPIIETRVLRSGKKIRLGNKASSWPDEEDRECTLAAEETKIALEECEEENKNLDGSDKDKIETETLVQQVDQTEPTVETDQSEDVNKQSPKEPNTVEEEQCAEEQNEEEMASATEIQVEETEAALEESEEDKEKSEEEITKAELNREDILVTNNVDENNETVQKNYTAKETINQPAIETEEERAGDEVSTIEKITSQTPEPNDSLNESVIPVVEKAHDEETDDSIHKLQEASVILVDLKSTNQLNVITPHKKCSSITEEKLDQTVETEREVSISVADGQTEPKELLEDLVGQKEMGDATTEMEMSEQRESEMHIRKTRVLRSGKKSKRVSSRKSKSALQEETSKVDISGNKEVDLPVLEGDLAQENILPNETVKEISSDEDDIGVVETRARRVSQKLTVTPRSSRSKAVKKGEKNSHEEQQASPTRTLRHRKPTVYATPTRKYRRSHKVTNEDEKIGKHVEDNAMNEDSAIELVDKKDDKIDETNLNEDEQIKLDLGENVAPTTSEDLEEHAEKAAPEEGSSNNDGQSPTVTRVLQSGKKTLRGHKPFQNEVEEEEEAKKVKLDKETTEEIIQIEEPVTAELAFPSSAEELDTDGFSAPVDDAVQEEEIIEGHTSEEVTYQLSHIQNVTIDSVDLRKNERVHKPVPVETMTVDTVQDNSDIENKNDEIIEETEAPTIETRVLRSGKKIRLGNKASSQADEDRECTLAAEETKIALEECEEQNKKMDGSDKDKIETETLVQKVDQTEPTAETDQSEDVNKQSPKEPNTVEGEQCAEEQNEEEMTSAAETQVEETKAALEESEEVEICFEKVEETSEVENNTYKEDQTKPEVQADQKTVENEALLLKETDQDMQNNSTPVKGEETFRKMEEETIIATPDDNEQIEEAAGAATTTDDDEPLLEGKKLRKVRKSTAVTPQRKSRRVCTRLQQEKQEESASGEEKRKHTEEAMEKSEEEKISTEKADETASHEEEFGVAIDQEESVAVVIVTDVKMAEEEEVAVDKVTLEIQDDNRQTEEEATDEDGTVVEPRMLRSRRSTPTTPQRKSKRSHKRHHVEEAQGEETENTYNRERENVTDETEASITLQDTEDGVGDETTEEDEPVEYTRVLRKGRKSMTATPRCQPKKVCTRQPEDEKGEQSSPIKETQEVASDEKTVSETNQKVTEVGDQDHSDIKEVEAGVSPIVQENVEEDQSVVSEICLVGQEDISVSRNVEETSTTDSKIVFKEAEANTTLQNSSEQESQAAGEESSDEAEPLEEKGVLKKRGRHTPTTSRRKSKRTSKKHRTEEDKVEETNPAEETEEEEDETRQKQPELEVEMAGEQEGSADNNQVESQLGNAERTNYALTADTCQGEVAISTEALENTTKYIIQSSPCQAGNSDKEGNAIVEEKLISSTELESEPVTDEAEKEKAFLVTQVLRSETKTWLVTPSQSFTSENIEKEKTLNTMMDNKEAESDLAEDSNEQESEHSVNEKTKQLNEETLEELESEAQEDIPHLSLDTDEVEEGGTGDMSDDEVEPIVITRRDLRGRSIPGMIITPRSKSRRSSGRVQKADKSSSDEERSPQSQMRSNRKRRSTEGTPGHRAKRHSRV